MDEQGRYNQAYSRFTGLLEGKARKAAETYINRELHKSLSHLSEPHQRNIILAGKTALLERYIKDLAQM